MALKLIKRHGSPIWYMRGTVRGQTVDASTKTADKAQAEQVLALTAHRLFAGSVGVKVPASFREAAAGYVRGGGDDKYLPRLVEHFGARALAEIGQAEVEDAARVLYPDAAPSTINRQVFTPVSAVLTHAAKRRLCDKPAFDRPEQPRGRVRWLTHEEADRLIENAAEHLQPLLTFLLFTGCRVGEAMALDWRDVDLDRAHATFLETKNGERRGIPLHAKALLSLADLPHRSGAVFRRPDGMAYAEREDSGGQIKTGFATACRRAGILEFHPHDCRHTWATWHYAANRDLVALMRLGGWKSMSMVLRYAHIDASDLAPGVAKISQSALRSQMAA